MASQFDDVINLRPGKETWRMLVKIIRIWYSQGYTNSKLPLSLEMVVMDAKGDKIHVIIRKTIMYKFETTLIDGNVYSMSYFEVADNTGLFKPTKHPYKVNFQFNTEVRPMNQNPISVDPYSFVPLADVMSTAYDTNFLIDVIGILTVVGTERVIESHGKKTKMNVIEIDSYGVKMECALFGPYVEDLNLFLNGGEMVNVVILLQFVKVKTWQGNLSLQNVHGATKMLFNPAVDIAVAVMERFSASNDTGSQSLSQLQDSSKVVDEEDFLILTPRKTIAQVHDMKENSVCIVYATISYVEEGMDWWYTACKCNKKVYPDEKMYFCEVCNRHVVHVIPM
ncbi:uncharacterized protein LOC130743368 [Lotus japonicus]|uniref:uncharacterized protein LOC130728861 n=1 Tax=Lotus japonicus TaxID=34305 RepID=UPI002589A0EA|nr:uncharacterized protein LOC130728861 [Lotus japonicus]XP_057446168.1 uncharacterized protein LOC130738246 [Lotus japonicus]XP_057451574.1 uncharacterized protein LOC130743368 [Lotus japonicus]XP_057451575.1 uncharacterized protein LOC130743368 [Lotus japonicus]